ncbi:MAG TPA: carbamoyltransferase C-terminal domain-containing protein [Thermoleophilaceae bacterium]
MLLGVNAYSNNAGMALYDGEVHMVLEEERFDRQKKSHAFPRLALEATRPGGWSEGEIEAVCFPWSPGLFARTFLRALAAELPQSLQLLLPASSREDNSMLPLRAALQLKRQLGRHVRGGSPPVRYVEHHQAHAALAFFSSPFDDALVVVADAFGDKCSLSAFVGRDNGLTEVYVNRLMDSLGILYSSVTHHLGYKTVLDEGKVMALASFGTDEMVPEFRKIVDLAPGGSARFDYSWLNYHRAGEIRPFTERFERLFGPRREPGAPLEQRHKDLAKALQTTTEEALLHLVGALKERHGARNLVLVGGVALNCVAAGRLARELGFDDTFIPANPDDGGTPLGAAMWHMHCQQGRPRGEPVGAAYHGTGYSDAEIDRALGSRRRVEVRDPAEEAAALLADGRTVAWFQGRMEMGPRALGNRSILADPRSETMQDHLNSRVKHREPYRPYAPSVLDEAVAEWYPGSPYSPFMSFTSTVADGRGGDVPAVTHVDGTARVQSVRRDVAPLYHDLISAFARRTGIPLVLNTSLNDRDPICCTPEHAIACFEGTELDALFVGNRLLLRDPESWKPAAEVEAEARA